jgi:hypothetical protein
VTFWLNLVELFQLPAAPVTSEDDKERTNPHLAFPSLGRRNVVRATAAAIARGKRNSDPVLSSQHCSTETPKPSSKGAVLTVFLSFYLGRQAQLSLGD